MELEIENTEVVSSNEIQVEVPNSIEVTEGEKDYEVSVVKKEYTIIGDSIFIPSMYEDAPPWLKEFIETTLNVAVTNRDQSLIDRLQSMLSLLDYVPKNQYTEQINQIVSEDGIINSRIATLNSNFTDSINTTNATIAEINLTYASKNEAAAIASNILTASLSGSGQIGSTLIQLQEAYADLESTTAQSISMLESVMEGELSGNASAMEEIRTEVTSINGELSSHAGQITTLQTSVSGVDGKISTAKSEVINTVNTTIANGDASVETKWGYNSTVNINGVYKKSGFGLTTNYTSGSGTQANPYVSEFWIDASRLKFTNSNQTGRTSPFTIDATGTTPQITFNGVVSFTNVSNTSGLISSISNAQSTANTANSNALARTLPREVANAINTNTTTINGSKITTGTITADSIAANTITADRISSGELDITGSTSFSGSITTIGSFNSGVTASDSLVGTFTISNTFSRPVSVVVFASGRSGVTNATSDPNESVNFSIFANDYIEVFSYGWSPMIQDAKSAGFSYSLPANTTVTFYVRGRKTHNYSLTLILKPVWIGVRN